MEAARQMYFLFLYCWRSARGYWLGALSDVQGAETLPSPGEQVDGVDDEYPHAYHHHDVYCHIHGEALFDDCVDNVTAFKHVPGGLNSSRYPVTNFFTCFFSSRRIRAVHPTARGVVVFLRKRISTSHHLTNDWCAPVLDKIHIKIQVPPDFLVVWIYNVVRYWNYIILSPPF